MLQNFRDSLAIDLYGMTKDEAIKQGICIDCSKPIQQAKLSEADWREYNMSGLCPDCWDKTTEFE